MRSTKDISDEIKGLVKEFNVINTKEHKQRIVLCNKWKMYWLLTEVLEKYENES